MSRVLGKDFLITAKEALAKDKELNRLMDANGKLDSLITYKPSINATQENIDTGGGDRFITLSINRVTNYENLSQWAIKVGVALNISSRDDRMIEIFEIVRRITDILEDENLNYGFAEQLQFGEMEETYFDKNQNLWGYIMIFLVNDEVY